MKLKRVKAHVLVEEQGVVVSPRERLVALVQVRVFSPRKFTIVLVLDMVEVFVVVGFDFVDI